MRTKSYRRHKQFYKFKRRAELWKYRLTFESKEIFWRKVKKGKHSWLRTTGKPCSCKGCSPLKYKRLSNSEIKKILIVE